MNLQEIREHLDKTDKEIVRLIAERMSYMPAIAEHKKEHGIARYQPDREKGLIEHKRQLARDFDVSEDLIEDIFCRLIEEAHNIQKKYID